MTADEAGENTVATSPGSDLADPDEVTQVTGAEIRRRLFPPKGDDSASPEGLRLQHFLLTKQIGSGGMGSVFLAEDQLLSRPVALKVLLPHVASDRTLATRFRNEARASARLSHDNIAQVYYFGEQEGIPFIAYEFADGRTIRDRIQTDGVLSPEEVISYTIQVCHALAHMQSSGVVHRDIKPSNLIVSPNGRIKVVDMGLARRDANDSVGDITVAGATLGTFDYMAPEQARNPSAADVRSDIYSLGCSAFHMLTGKPPYGEGTALQKLLDHQGRTPPAVASLRRDVPPALSDIVQRMMSTQPDDRYQTPGQVLADLTELADAIGLQNVPAEGTVWRRVRIRPVRNVSGTLVTAGAVAMICLTALVMHFFPAAEPEFNPVFTGPGIAAQDQGVSGNGSSESDSGDTPPTISEADGSRAAIAGTDGGPDPPQPDSSASDVASMVSGTPPGTLSSGAEGQPGRAGSGLAEDPAGAFVLLNPSGDRTVLNSLEEAVSRAVSGDRIQLRFNRVERLPADGIPRLSEQHLSIEAAPGYRPVLRFDRTERSGSLSRLFQLSSNSTLTITGVTLQISRVPTSEDFADQLILFALDGPNRLMLDRVSILLDEPAGTDAIRVVLLQDTGSLPGSLIRDTGVRMTSCFVRGSGTLVEVAGQHSGDLQLQQCMLALDGSLLSNVGSRPMSAILGDLVLTAEHVTALTTGPVFRMQDTDFPDGSAPDRRLPHLSVISRSCLWGGFGAPVRLVDSRGNAYPDDQEELLSWQGVANLYYNISDYWHIESGGTALGVRTFPFIRWQENWGSRSDGSETDAALMDPDAWASVEEMSEAEAYGVAAVVPRTLATNRSAFFGTGAVYTRGPDDQIPGADAEKIPLPLVPGSEAPRPAEPDQRADENAESSPTPEPSAE